MLAALPASSAAEVACQLALLSLAALGQALLRACCPADAPDEPPCTAWPHALQPEAEAAAARSADARSGLGHSAAAAAPPAAAAPAAAAPAGGMSGAQREEASALDALRERLAAAARLRVHEAAPRGAALLCVVGVAMEHASAMGDLLLHAARPAELAPRAAPFSLAGGGTPPSGLCSVTACDALRSEAALALLERWAAACAPPVPLPRTLLARGPAVLQLHVMPSDFSALTAQLHGRGCIYCDAPPLEPAVCLLCGALVCAGPNCRRRRAARARGRRASARATRARAAAARACSTSRTRVWCCSWTALALRAPPLAPTLPCRPLAPSRLPSLPRPSLSLSRPPSHPSHPSHSSPPPA